jgi:hypothetical protein
MTTEALEKINTDLESLEFLKFFQCVFDFISNIFVLLSHTAPSKIENSVQGPML